MQVKGFMLLDKKLLESHYTTGFSGANILMRKSNMTVFAGQPVKLPGLA
jgi:hypothetical protein